MKILIIILIVISAVNLILQIATIGGIFNLDNKVSEISDEVVGENDSDFSICEKCFEVSRRVE